MLSSLKEAFQGKKVLITGHSGFKGKWLSRILKILGSQVYGFSIDSLDLENFGLDSYTKLLDKEYLGDIRDHKGLIDLLENIKPDFIFHLAAQALVKESIRDPIYTYQTNVLGTCNLLSSLNLSKTPCTVVLITSDKVYDNKEWLWGYREIDKLGGIDPYSASKAMAEISINSFINTYDYFLSFFLFPSFYL